MNQQQQTNWAKAVLRSKGYAVVNVEGGSFDVLLPSGEWKFARTFEGLVIRAKEAVQG